MRSVTFTAPSGVDPALIDLHRLTDAVTALGVALEEGVSLRGDGTFTANAATDFTAALTGLNWNALRAAAPVDRVAALQTALADKSAELASVKATLVDALTGTAAQKATALALIKAWKAGGA